MTDRPSQRPFRLPDGAVELMLVRHGAAAGQDAHVVAPSVHGHNDPPLTELGFKQAESLGDYLAGEAIAAIFTSPLQRALTSAEPLAERTRLVVTVVDDLREVHMGEWEHGEFEARTHRGDPIALRVYAEERWELVPGAETAAGFAARVRNAVDTVAGALRPGQTGAVFAHAAVIAEVCRQATASRPFAFLTPDNGSITRVIVHADKALTLRGYNDIGHLRAVANAAPD